MVRGGCGGPARSQPLHAGGTQLASAAPQYAVPSSSLDSSQGPWTLTLRAHPTTFGTRCPGAWFKTCYLLPGPVLHKHSPILGPHGSFRQTQRHAASRAASGLPSSFQAAPGVPTGEPGEGCPHSSCNGDVDRQHTDPWSEGVTSGKAVASKAASSRSPPALTSPGAPTRDSHEAARREMGRLPLAAGVPPAPRQLTLQAPQKAPDTSFKLLFLAQLVSL